MIVIRWKGRTSRLASRGDQTEIAEKNSKDLNHKNVVMMMVIRHTYFNLMEFLKSLAMSNLCQTYRTITTIRPKSSGRQVSPNQTTNCANP